MITFEDLYNSYLKAKNNHKRSRDVNEFEQDLEENLIKLYYEINNRTLTLNDNYSFIVEEPKPREIFATRMKARIVHHLLDTKLRPIYEQVLSPNTFNNRKDKGLYKAIEKVYNDIKIISNNYTSDAYIFHLDFKGFFPNANIDIVHRQQQELIDKFYTDNDKEDIKHLMNKCLYSDPARHCIKVGDLSLWNYIKPEKSLFNKPFGTGAAIGFLCWQNAMQIYPNDIMLWLDTLNLKSTLFVDDLYIVCDNKEYVLSKIPEMRKRLSKLKIELNENKFYCQHYSKGILCLGKFLKYR